MSTLRKPLEISLIDSVAEGHLQDLTADGIELAIDQALDGGLLEEILS